MPSQYIRKDISHNFSWEEETLLNGNVLMRNEAKKQKTKVRYLNKK